MARETGLETGVVTKGEESRKKGVTCEGNKEQKASPPEVPKVDAHVETNDDLHADASKSFCYCS